MTRIAFLIFILLNLISSRNLYAQRSTVQIDIVPYADIHSFNWTERENNGDVFVNESGFRYTAALLPQIYVNPLRKILMESDLRYTFGTVSYDGYLLNPDGTQTPYVSRTAYSGYDGSLYAGYLVRFNNFSGFRPMGGVGMEFVQRNLDEGGSYGYTENFSTYFANLGLRLELTPADHFRFSISGFIRKPFSASLTIPVNTGEDLEPSEIHLTLPKNATYHFSAELHLYGFFLSMYYNSWYPAESDADQGFYLPASERVITGLKMGYVITILQ